MEKKLTPKQQRFVKEETLEDSIFRVTKWYQKRKLIYNIKEGQFFYFDGHRYHFDDNEKKYELDKLINIHGISPHSMGRAIVITRIKNGKRKIFSELVGWCSKRFE